MAEASPNVIAPALNIVFWPVAQIQVIHHVLMGYGPYSQPQEANREIL
jgi:hypothetical protein